MAFYKLANGQITEVANPQQNTELLQGATLLPNAKTLADAQSPGGGAPNTGAQQPAAKPADIPPSAQAPAGISFSALGDTMTQLQEFEKSQAAEAATLEKETESLAGQQRDVTAETIKAGTETTRTQLQQMLEAGQYQINKAGELLAIPDVQIKGKIDDYQESTKTFYAQMTKAFSDLDTQEKTALEQNDLTYLQNIRQSKVDYLNMQRQFMTDHMNFITTAYNTLLTGQQYQRQATIDAQTMATNQLNTLIQAYAGKGLSLENLSPEDQATAASVMGTLGLSVNAINGLFASGSGNTSVIHDTTTGWVTIIDKNTGRQISSFLMPGRSGASTAGGTTSGSFQVPPGVLGAASERLNQTRGTDGYVDTAVYLKFLNDWEAQGGLSKDFLREFPPKDYLNADPMGGSWDLIPDYIKQYLKQPSTIELPPAQSATPPAPDVQS